MKIGQLVKRFVPNIIDYCLHIDQEEIVRLQDLEYSKNTFGVSSYPFWSTKDNINESKRFWTDIYIIHEDEFRVSSQWTIKHIKSFKEYLIDKNITTEDELDKIDFDTEKANNTKLDKKLRSNSRYKSNAIGNAQNLLVRNILSNLGDETFDEKDWNNTKEFFDNGCAYCGSKEKLIMEHAVPINKTMLGEHKLGNIIPSCNSCNKKKASKNYDDFLGDKTDKTQKIEEYMNSKNYKPLNVDSKSEIILELLEKAYLETAEVSKRYIQIIEMIQNNEK
ncbi:MAG: HNH endonuclease [Flavobacteriaceae bacterium]|nr:HNH endonuclease [Flavobacteriaceae bacterium]